MPETPETDQPLPELDERFSSPDAAPTTWAATVATLEQAEIFWLSTARGDGRPHVSPLPAMWHDRALHFCTGPGEQKHRNLESNDRCVLTTGSSRFRAGLDVVVEGRAVRVTDEARLRRLAEMWKVKLDWEFQVADGAFQDGNRTAHVFGVEPEKILVFGRGDLFSQTRFRFTAG